MELIITEKRSAAHDLSLCLLDENFKAQDGYMTGQHYCITWCAGHLYSLLDLDEYLPGYDPNKKTPWSLDVLPYFPEEFRYKVSQPKNNPSMCQTIKKQIKVIRMLLNSENITAVYHCGDADREGEVIVRNVVRVLMKEKKPVYRIWLNAFTPKLVKDALSSKTPDREYDGWYRAGQARAFEDWLFGINGTRYLSLKAGVLLPWGRCKYIITEAIVNREREIQDFKPVDYFSVESNIKPTDDSAMPLHLTSKKTFPVDQETAAKALADEFNAFDAFVLDVLKDRKEVSSGKLFTTTDLQSFVSSHYKDVDPRDVEAALESLYQKGYSTYPRTNSAFLVSSDVNSISEVIDALKKKGFQNIENKPNSKAIYNDSKVDGHSALTPTYKIPDLSELSAVEKITYTSILNRFLAVFCSVPCLEDVTTIKIQCGDEVFTVNGSILVQEGWRMYEESSKKDKELPALEKGMKVAVAFTPIKKQTTPPKRFTVTSLGNWCLSPWKKTDEDSHEEYSDEDWERILHEATICTDATRTPTITACRDAGYIQLKSKTYYPLDKGIHFIDACRKIGLTFTVKEVLDISTMLFDVRKDACGVETCIETAKDKVIKMFEEKDNEAVKISDDFEAENAICDCPKCGKPIAETARSFKCSNEDCTVIIWKESRLLSSLGCKKKSFTKKDAITLLSGKAIELPDCVSKKSGKKYSCLLTLDVSGEKCEFKIGFPDQSEEAGAVVGPCPVCGKDMVEHSKVYVCSNQDCKFTLWKQSKRYSDVLAITKAKAKKLLDGKGVDFSITDKNGKPYSATLLLNTREYNGKIYPQFDIAKKD